MIAVDQTVVESETNQLILYIAPINCANDTRHGVVSFIRDILHKSALLDGYIIECGSSSLKSYLPESDLDLVLLAPSSRSSREEISCLTTVFNSWCDEIADKDEGKSVHAEMTIRNVEFVNARTKLAHCLVNNISVDITINQIGAILTVTFLEEADRLIGGNHLFKRSLLLIKTWCLHESARYCGAAITGAKAGMLSSYAVSVMVLHIFNKYTNLTHPFSVLRSFLFTYMSFPWDTQVLTIDGTLPISAFTKANHNGSYFGSGRGYGQDSSDLMSVSTHNSNGSSTSGRQRGSFHLPPPPLSTSSLESNRFQTILDAIGRHPASAMYQQSGNTVHHSRFTAKFCNIQDPVDGFNNLGISVSRGSLQLITQACRCGYNHLENFLRSRFAHYPPAPSSAAEGQESSFNIPVPPPLPPLHHHQQQHQQMVSGVNQNTYSNNINITNNSAMNIGINNISMDDNMMGISGNKRDNNLEVFSGDVHHTYTAGSQTNKSAGSTPYRRNSRPGHSNSNNTTFLSEFFPVSLQLYVSTEGEPLRCDLLSHPLQPLSSSSLLAHPSYSSGIQSSPSQPARRKSLGLANDLGGLLGGDVASVTSANSGATDNWDSSVRNSWQRSVEGGQSGSPGNLAQDPLLGDLQAMYEALDMFVTSRRSAHTSGPAVRGCAHMGNSTESTSAPYLNTPSASALCAAEIKALTARMSHPHTPSNSNSTPADVGKEHSLGFRASSGSPFQPTALASKEKKPHASIHDNRNSSNEHIHHGDSPDGSTTSGTESVRLGIDAGISISDDSDTNSGSGCESDQDGNDSDNEKEEDCEPDCNLLGIAATAMPYSPPKAQDEDKYQSTTVTELPINPIGSVVAFFRDTKWFSIYSQAVVENLQFSLQAFDWKSPKPHPEDAPTKHIAPVSTPIVKNGKRKGLQRGEARPSSAGGQSSPSNCAEKKNTAAAAAAASRRSKRTLTQRAINSLHVWWSSLANSFGAIRTAIMQSSLATALMYSVLMILVINLALKAERYIPEDYAIFWRSSDIYNVNFDYTDKVRTLNEWIHNSSATMFQVQEHPPSARITNATQESDTEETPKSAFDFTSSQFSLFRSSDMTMSSTIAPFLQASLGRYSSSSSGSATVLVLPTHWVQEGDSITFGDFGSYHSSTKMPSYPSPSGTQSASLSPATGTAGPGVSKAARVAASTTTASTLKTRSVPSEDVQKTQYIPKPEYVLAANSGLGSPYQYQWTKDGVEITNKYYQNQPYFSIKKTRLEDGGVYRCFRYEVALTNAPAVLVTETAIQISRPPTVNLKPSYHEIKAGTSMVLNLAAEGTPPPVFQWYKNGYPVPGLTSQVLLMEAVNASHSGTYSCDVQNIAGGFLWLEATILVVD